MQHDLNTELGYVMMDLDSMREYVSLAMRDYSKAVDRIACIRIDLTNDRRVD